MSADITTLVTDNLELWTGAVERKTGAGRGGGRKVSHYGIERLRALILDLAVRGKLVPQDPGEGSADSVLSRIDAGRSALVDAGFIRGSKESANDVHVAAPFAIPSSWRWVRLDRLGAIVGGGTPPANDPTNFAEPGEGHPWLTPADLSGFDEDTIDRGQRDLTDQGLASSSAKLMPAGTVLFTSRAPIGYVAIAANELATNQGFKSIVPSIDGMSDFIALALKAFAEEIDANASGTTFKEVSGKIVEAIPFPLPPLSEQQRIVAKVKELLALCDALESQSISARRAHQTLVEALLTTLANTSDADDLACEWLRIENHFEALFTTDSSVDVLKRTILDLAVRGKIAPQDENEGSGQALLEEIRLSREKLEASGNAQKLKLVRRARLTDIAPDLPANWTVAKIAELTSVITDGTHHTPKYIDDGVAFISVKDINGQTISFDNCRYISQAEHEKINARCNPVRDDILLCRIGTLGRATIVDTDRPFSLFVSVGLLKFVPTGYNPRYQHIALSSPFLQMQFDKIKAGGSHTNKLNLSDLPSLEIPLPPLAEQSRIVAKVDELMALCDALRARLAGAEQTRRCLADAVFEKALA